MTNKEVREKVIPILQDNYYGESGKEIISNTLLGEEFDMREIVMTLEETFKLDIPDEQAEKFTQVRHIVEYINKKLTKK